MRQNYLIILYSLLYFHTSSAYLTHIQSDQCEYPFVVSLSRVSPNNSITHQICSGTLLTSNWVLTLSRCIASNHRDIIIVALDGQKSKIVRLVTYDKFVRHRGDQICDLGLAKTRRKFKRTSQVHPISIIRRQSAIQQCEIEILLVFARDLNKINCIQLDYHIANYKICQRIFKAAPYAADGTLQCAEKKILALEEADFGGPVLCNGHLIGILALSRENLRDDNTNSIGFTSLERFNNFISITIGIERTFYEDPMALHVFERHVRFKVGSSLINGVEDSDNSISHGLKLCCGNKILIVATLVLVLTLKIN